MNEILPPRPHLVCAFGIVLFFAIAAVICSRATFTRISSHAPNTSAAPADSASLAGAKLLFSKGDITRASNAYQSVLVTSNDKHAIAAAHIGIGICALSKHDYSSALRSFDHADALIQTHWFSDLAAVLALNRAAFYRMIGNRRAARETIEGAVSLAQSHPDIAVRLQYAVAISDEGNIYAAKRLISACIEEASKSGDLATEASAWSQLGSLSLQTSDVGVATDSFANALRIRKAIADGRLGLIYLNLARLYLMTGQFQLAETFLRRSAESSNGNITDAARSTLAGDIADAQGNHVDALRHYTAALLAAYSRIAVLDPADFLRSYAQSEVHRITIRYVHTAAADGHSEPAAAALQAVEIGRRLSFGAPLHRVPVPAEISEKLHQLTVDALNDNNSGALRAHFHEVRFQRDRLQLLNGVSASQAISAQVIKSGSDFVRRLQSRLHPTEAFISILLDVKASYLWAVTPTSFEFHQLPSSRQIEPEIASFVKNLSESRAALSSGTKLGHTLFGRLSPRAMSASDWIVSADGAVLNLPLAALSVRTKDSSTHYLARSNSIRMVPSALPLGNADAPVPRGRLKTLLLYGDPIYNRADFRGDFRYHDRVANELVLPRLPGTWSEMQSCAIAWLNKGRRVEFMFGRSATRRDLQTALNGSVEIFHFAGHSVSHPFHDADQALALGLNDAGKQEILTSDDIMSSDAAPALVIMSSCASARGTVVQGAGVLNLSRSWLQAGSSTVVHTYWPVPDGTGRVLTDFYRNISLNASVADGRTIARALAKAQRRLIESDGVENDPTYWASYGVISRE